MSILSTKAAIEQIEKCDFECEGGPLANNVGWRWLKGQMSGGPLYCLGQWVTYQIEAEVSGVKIAQDVKLCVVAIHMSSDTDRRTWKYSLSKDPPHAYYSGSGVQFSSVAEAKLTPVAPALPTKDGEA